MDNLKKISEAAVVNAKQYIAEGKSVQWNLGATKLSESIGTADGGADFVEKVTFDVYQGREAVPTIYNQLYSTTVDANYPKVLVENTMGPVQVVFVKTMEFEGVRFGTLSAGETVMVEFATYAAGIEYTEDMVEYNSTWEITEIAVAFGENYNKMLNNVHLSPITTGTYVTTGIDTADQKVAQKAGTAQLIAYDTSIEVTLKSAMQVLPKGTKMLANSFDQNKIEAALFGSMYADNTPTMLKRSITPDDIIYYDGDEVVVGDKTYEYVGVTAGTAFLITPARQLKSRVKHDLRITALDEDPRRLIKGGAVGRSRLAAYSGLGGEYGAIKIALE